MAGRFTPISDSGFVVHPSAAKEQLEEERQQLEEEERRKNGETTTEGGTGVGDGPGPGPETDPPEPDPIRHTRFFGTIDLDPTRLNTQVGNIAQEIIQHMAGLPGCKLEITLDVTAENSDGFPESVMRTVRENCNTLKFKSSRFEED